MRSIDVSTHSLSGCSIVVEALPSADPIQRDTIRRDWQNQRYNEPIIRPLFDGRLILHKLLSTKFVIFCPRDVDGVR